MKERIEIMKKIISVILTMMMVMCFIPSLAFADSTYDLSSATVSIPDIEWTGNAINLNPTVTVNGTTLTEGAIYTVLPETVTNPGKYTATISAISGAAVNEKTATFYVKKDMSKLSPQISSQISGTTVTASAVTIMDGSKKLVAGTDYTISAKSPSTSLTATNGTNYITVTGIGDSYKGTKEISYHAGLSFSVTLPSYTTYTYSGSEIKPAITVMSGNRYLYEDTDYTVSYSNNTNVGTGTIIVTGKGSYGGVTTRTFQIVRLPLSIYNLTVANKVRGGNLAVYYGDKLLASPQDYTLGSVNDSTYSGSATIYLNGNYSGSGTIYYSIVDPSYNIALYNNSYLTFDQTIYMYTGSPIIPTASLRSTYNGSSLSSSNYTVKGYNNTNVGRATATFIGTGAYGGAFDRPFSITALDLSKCSVSLNTSSYVYNGVAKMPTVTVKYGSATIPTKDYTVRYADNIYTGTATVTVYASTTGNCYGTNKATFTITGTDINACSATLSQTNYNYTGYSFSPAVVVKYGSTTLTNGTDYTVAYSDNIKSGTAKVTITGKRAYSGTRVLNYYINGKANSIYTNTSSYTKYLSSDIFNLGASSAGDETGFAYKSSDETVAKVSATGVVSIVGTGKATITISTVGTSAYNPATKDITIKVKPSKITPKLYTAGKGKLKVRVTKSATVTKYQIRYGRAGSYKYTYITPTENGYATQSKTISKLKSGYKYYVKVRPYKLASDGEKIYGNWSSTKSLRVR